MRNFGQGILWGSVIGMMLRFVISPIMSKPLVERSTDAVISTTHGLMRQARKRLMHMIKIKWRPRGLHFILIKF